MLHEKKMSMSCPCNIKFVSVILACVRRMFHYFHLLGMSVLLCVSFVNLKKKVSIELLATLALFFVLNKCN